MHADAVFEFLSHLRSVFPIYGKNRAKLHVLFSHLRSHLRSILRRRDSILWTRRTDEGTFIETTGRNFEQEITEITETDNGISVPLFAPVQLSFCLLNQNAANYFLWLSCASLGKPRRNALMRRRDTKRRKAEIMASVSIDRAAPRHAKRGRLINPRAH